MDARTLGTLPEDPEFHPLLSKARRSDGDASIPEPLWLLDTETGWIVLWAPNNKTLPDDAPVLLIENPDDWDPWELVLSLWDRYREQSDLEKARVVSTLADRIVESNRRRLADLLALPASKPLFEAMKDVFELPEPLRMQLHDGSVSIRLIRYLRELPEAVRGWVTDALAQGRLKLSVQDVRKLADAARRLPEDKREEWKTEAESTLNAEEPRKCGRDVMSLTRQLAYPRTRKRKQKFEATLDEIDPDGRINVTPPDNFEGDYLDFRFRCRRDEDLTKLAEELKECQQLLEHL